MTTYKLALLNEIVGAFGAREAMKVKKLLYCRLCGKKVFGPGRDWREGDAMCHCIRKIWGETVVMVEDGTLFIWKDEEL